MANILITGVWDELREENKRLSNENKVLFDLLEKYRKCLLNLNTICECNQRNNNHILIQSLEKVYKRCLDQKFQEINILSNNKNKKTEVIKQNSNNQRRDLNIDQKLQETNESKDNVITDEQTSVQSKTEDNELKYTERESELKSTIITSPSIKTQLRIIGRINRKIIAKKVKPKSDPKVISIPEPEEEPNSVLLLRRNNYNSKTKTYVCPNPFCEKSFQTKRRLSAHFCRVHKEKERYFCDHQNCNKSFKDRAHLESHSVVHSDIRPFMCSVKDCNKRFKRAGDVTKHQLFHTDIKPYKCSECQSSFKLNAELKRHSLKHKSVPSYKCNYEDCHQFFKTEYFLEKHKRVAHNYTTKGRLSIKRCVWPGCDYQSNKWHCLSRHRRIHTGEKPYLCECPDCGKRFSLRKTLTEHLLLHKDLKPFPCVWPGCQHRSRSSGNLSKHMKVHQK